MSSPQLNWEEWEGREANDPMKTYRPTFSEEHYPSGENLEAWKYVAGEFGKLDVRETRACKEDMDTLIMVAGLFSAVFATFNCEYYKQLQPSSEGTSAYFLAQVAHHLNETLVTAEVVERLRPISQPSSSTAVINALWFSGLVLSLMTAAGAMSIKQWLRDYSATTVHLPHHYCRLRFFRRSAFSKYKVYEIASSLPYVLQCALTLFLIGLAYFLWELDALVFGAVLIPLVVWLALYVAAIILSMIDPACPYTIPVIGNLYHFLHLPALRLKLFIYRQLGRKRKAYPPHCSPYQYHDLDHTARTVSVYDALVLVSAYSTFQTHDINQQVTKAFRTVHLGKIDRTAFLRYLFTPSNKLQLSQNLHYLLQPAVKAILTCLFPSMPSIQDIGVDRYLYAVHFAFNSADVGRSRMGSVLDHICGLHDEHLSSGLVEHVWNAVSPCFDFYMKDRGAIHPVGTRVIDVFTKFLSLRLSDAPRCYSKFANMSRSYGNDLALNWIGCYLFLLTHSRRHLDAATLSKSHSVFLKFSDLVQYVINRYQQIFTQDAITRAQLCLELAEEFQDKYTTSLDPALLTGLKYIVSIKEPFVVPNFGDRWQQAKSSPSSSDHILDRTTQKDTPAVDSAEGKEGGAPAQSTTGSDSDTPTLPVNKED